jgi:Secretion system C-terminal sorting domain
MIIEIRELLEDVMKFMKLRILLMLLISILTTSSLYSQEWIQGKGFPVCVSAIEVAEYDSSTVFIGTLKSGIWRRNFSTDTEWQQIINGFPEREYTEEEMNSNLWYLGDYHEITSIETNQNLPGVVFVGGNGISVFRSTNSGDSWEEWGSLDTTWHSPVYHIEIISSVPEKVVAITYSKAYVNNNQNSDWTFFPTGFAAESDTIIRYINEDPHVDGRLLASVRGSGNYFFMESLNHGDDWTQLPAPDWNDIGYHKRLFFDPSDSLRIYFSFGHMEEFQAIMTTDNGGESWYSSPHHPRGYSDGYVRAVDSNGTMYATMDWDGYLLFKSYDQLGSFHNAPMVTETIALSGYETKYIEFVGASDTFIAGGWPGIYKSDDAGDTFHRLNHGINKGYIEYITTVPNNENTLIAYSVASASHLGSGVFKSLDGGYEWECIISKSIYDLEVSPVDNNLIIASHSISCWRSQDGGDSWFYVDIDHTAREVIWSSNSTDTLYSSDRLRIRRSTDSGYSWDIVYEQDVLMNKLIMHPVYNNKFWAASDVVMYSNDYCESWESINTTPDVCTDIFVLESDTARVFITCENENIYKLHSNGLGWINISEDLPRESWSHLGEMKPIPNEDAFLLVVKGQGIYHFNCDTEEWMLFEGDYDPRVTDVAVNDFGKIIISTSSDGVFVGDYVTPVSAVDPNINPELPTEVFLDDPYPNPFNSTVSIHFTLPYATQITLNVFDILGREVYQSSSHYSSGSHTKVLNSESDFVSNVASGIYFVQMKSDASLLTKKIMLLR